LKNWFRTSSGGQEYNIFVVIERLYVSESDDDASYDDSTREKSCKKERTIPVAKKEKHRGPIVKKEKRTESIVKKERQLESVVKKEDDTKSDIKSEKTESLVRSMQVPDLCDSQSARRKRSRSELSSISEQPSLPETSYVYRTRQRHALDEKDYERMAQYD
jgi:hypothetical protein